MGKPEGELHVLPENSCTEPCPFTRQRKKGSSISQKVNDDMTATKEVESQLWLKKHVWILVRILRELFVSTGDAC